MAKKKPKLTAEQRERIRQVELALRPYAVGDKVRLRKDAYHYENEPLCFNPRRRHIGVIFSVRELGPSLHGFGGFSMLVNFKHYKDDSDYKDGRKVTHWVRECDIERIK